MESFSVRRFGFVLAALLALLLLTTSVFRSTLELGWVDSAYRALLTVSLTGVAADPGGVGTTIFTGAVVLASVALFAYVATTLVEVIARGVLADLYGERRRRRRSRACASTRSSAATGASGGGSRRSSAPARSPTSSST